MTSTIKTYFGDYLLGLWVTWTSEVSSSGGTSDIEIEFKANLRSKLYVYDIGTNGDSITASPTYDEWVTDEGVTETNTGVTKYVDDGSNITPG